jgi:hypothetical protein
VECPNKGCRHKRLIPNGRVGGLTVHLRECKWTSVKCPNEGCTQSLLRKDLPEHKVKCDKLKVESVLRQAQGRRIRLMAIMRGTTSSTSLPASIMKKVAKFYHGLLPSDIRRATNPIAGVTQHNTRATILALVAKSYRPLGLDFAELWVLYDAAVPSADQMTYYIEFQRLVDQKIFVHSKYAPPGTERFVMQAGYNYRKDRMATLPSVKPTEEVIDQKILVPSDSSTPGMERGTIQVGYDHLTNHIAQLPSDEEDIVAPLRSLLVRSVRFESKARVRIIPHRLDFQPACAPA